MRLRFSREQAITQSRIWVDAYLRLGGSAAFQRSYGDEQFAAV